MTDFDPFASAPADDAAQAEAPVEVIEEPKPAPKKAATKKAAPKVEVVDSGVVGAPDRYTVTWKGGAGFADPWIVGRFRSIDEVIEETTGDNAVKLAKAGERVQAFGKHFASLGGGSASSGGSSRPAQQGQPRGSQEPPAGAPPAPGPDWEFRSGVGKSNGKPWKAWMPPRGSDEKPVFF